MSLRRLLLSLAASAGLLLPVAGAAVWALPLQAEAAVLPEEGAPPAEGPKADASPAKHRTEELQRLARQIKQLEKAILDPQTSGEPLAELKRQLLQLRMERAKRKAERPLFRIYDPLAKDDKDDEDC